MLKLSAIELFVKQNQSCCFQTVNDRFTTRKWATFASKVAEFLCVNNRVFFRNGWIAKRLDVQ